MRNTTYCICSEWEAVVKILFVDEQRLLGAMAPYHANLTGAEKALEIAKPPQVPTRVLLCVLFNPAPYAELALATRSSHLTRVGRTCTRHHGQRSSPTS